MVEYVLYIEIPIDYVSLEFESILDKPEEINYSDPKGNNLILHISKVIDPNFKEFFHNSFKTLIPEIEIKELFTLKSTNLSLFFLLLKIEIKLCEYEYNIKAQLDELLNWFPIIFDFFPEVPRTERIITNIPINEFINDKMVGHFESLFVKKKIKSLTMANYNFQSFISEYPRLSNSNILKKLNENLNSYYRDLFWDYNISIHSFNFYGKIPYREGTDCITLFKKITSSFRTYLISLYSFIGESIVDFLREIESFRYRISSLEFKKLVQYEHFFEDIYDNFFSNEITKWCRAKFEKWVFEHYNDKDFYLYKHVMIYRLPNFPKTYIRLKQRLQEALKAIKDHIVKKSKLKILINRLEFIKKSFPFLKTTQSFKQEIGKVKYFILLDKLGKIKEKCARGISAKDCEKCERSPSKVCLTKIFSQPLGKEVLLHCGTELADCYWISENNGNAIVIKGANLRTKKQYMDALSQIIDLAQKNTVKTIFFANNKLTSNQFFSQALNICKANDKQFIAFHKGELIQLLYSYEKTNNSEDLNSFVS